MSFTIQLDSNAAQVAQQVKRFPPAMLEAIARALDLENELTVGHIQRTKLSRRGPTTLGVVSNRLRSSARRTEARVYADGVESSLGSNVVYAGVHEFGYTGPARVNAFMRKNPAGDLFRVGPRGGRRQVASGISRVKAHTRNLRLPARAMFQTGLEERTANYTRSVSAAIVQAWQGGAS